MPIRQSWRTIVAALLFLSFAMLAMRWTRSDDRSSTLEDDWIPPAVRVARETPPTIVPPQEDWMVETQAEADAAQDVYPNTLDDGNDERPFLTPPLPHEEAGIETLRR